ALILFREPDSAANQVSNSQFQLGRRKRLFEKIYEIAGESLEVGSVVAFPICSPICRHKKNGQLWIITVQHDHHLSARKIGQFDVAHKEGKPATLSGGFDRLQTSRCLLDRVIFFRPEHVSDGMQSGRMIVQYENVLHKHLLGSPSQLREQQSGQFAETNNSGMKSTKCHNDPVEWEGKTSTMPSDISDTTMQKWEWGTGKLWTGPVLSANDCGWRMKKQFSPTY